MDSVGISGTARVYGGRTLPSQVILDWRVHQFTKRNVPLHPRTANGNILRETHTSEGELYE